MDNLSNIVFVSSEKDLINLKKYQKIQFKCVSCGKIYTRIYTKNRLNIIKKFQCKLCNYKETCLKKFGETNASKNIEVLNKIKKTNLKKYGNICSLNGVEQVKKKKETWKKNFGKNNPFQKKNVKQFAIKNSLESRAKSSCFYGNKYKLDNLFFDSSWEVYFYIYQRDHFVNIQRNIISYEYIFEGKKHITYVDFLLNGNEEIEIKGDYLLNNPLQKKRIEVLKDNYVNILYKKDIEQYKNWVYFFYGKNYINQFRLKREKNNG